MASVLYDKGRESFLKGEIAIATDNIKAVLVDPAVDAPDTTNDQFLSDIAGGARVATSGNLASKTTAAGVFDAADITITGVTGTGLDIILYQDTGSAATSRLIGKIDVGTGVPISSAGGDVLITWDNGANKIFKL